MKKLRATLYISLCAALLLFSACRAKKETIVKSDSTAVKNTATQIHQQETHIDTSKTTSTKTTEQKQVIITNDSTRTKTTITPVPGTQSVIDPDGTFHGQAQTINTEYAAGKKKTHTIDSKLQESAGELKGISDTKITDSVTKKVDSTAVNKLNTHTESKPSFGAWPWAWMIGGIIGLTILLWWFFGRPKESK